MMKVEKSRKVPMNESLSKNDENQIYPPLPMSKIPPSLWRGRERAGIRVDINFPLTFILYPWREKY
jgi:hypothetical protein